MENKIFFGIHLTLRNDPVNLDLFGIGLKLDRQKQPPEVFYKKKVFLKISKNSQETPVLESLF